MKKSLQIFFLLLAALITGTNGAWAIDFELSSANEVNKDGVTITFAKGSGSNVPAWYSAGLRLYAKNTITIKSDSEKITNITFNWEKQGSKAFASVSASEGNYSHPESTGDGEWTGSTNEVTFTLGTTGQLQLNTLSITLEQDSRTATTVAIDASGITNTNVFAGTAAGSLSAVVKAGEEPVDGASVTWSSSNENVATVADGAITLVAAGTTTITAIYAGDNTYRSSSATYELTVTNNDPNAPGTENNPYTVSAAIDATPASGTSANVYIKGVVSGFHSNYTDVTEDYSRRYYISDGTKELLVYNGKGLNNNDFTEGDLQIGDEVVILGGLTIYNNAPEVAANNYIVSLVRKDVPGLAWSAESFEARNGQENEFPTLTNDNNVEVTYSSTDEEVATVAADGAITLVANGTTTIKATFAGNDDYLSQEVSYTLTVKGFSKEAAGISFAEAEVNLTCGDEYEGQTLTNPNNLTVTWSSSNEDVAIVEDGVVVVDKAGTAVITATFAGNEDYLESVVSYTINVEKADAQLSFSGSAFTVAPNAEFTVPQFNNPNNLEVTWSSSDEDVAVADANDAVVGEKLGTATITASFEGNDYFNAGSASYTITVSDVLDYTWNLSTNSYSNASTTQVSWLSDYVTMVVNKATASTNANNYLGGANTSSRFYKNSQLTITPATGYEITSVEFVATTSNYASSLKNSTWTNATAEAEGVNVTVIPTKGTEAIVATIGGTCGFTSVKVSYRKAVVKPETTTITLNAACTDGEFVYGTFSSEKPFVVSDDIIVSEVAVIDGELLVEPYETGDVVPANIGVMVSALAAGDYEVVCSTEAGESVLGEENCLRATGNEGITASQMSLADPGSTYYRLTMHNGTQIGYWWGAENGAAFDIAPNKAYLAVPATVANNARSFWFGGDATGINAVEKKVENGVVYDLQGRRVTAPVRGLYIVNGKKVVIK